MDKTILPGVDTYLGRHLHVPLPLQRKPFFHYVHDLVDRDLQRFDLLLRYKHYFHMNAPPFKLSICLCEIDDVYVFPQEKVLAV